MTLPADREAALLTLVQWLSPAFPLGGYAHSHGLEQAMSTGAVRDARGLDMWLRDLLAEGSARCDAILLASVLNGADPARMDELARALAAGPERLEESLAQGRAFLDATNPLRPTRWTELVLPVAFGVQARALDLPVERVLALYLQAFLANLTLAAMRFVPLGQGAGHAVLAALAAPIVETAAALRGAGPERLAAATFGSDIAAMAHEHQPVRLFRT